MYEESRSLSMRLPMGLLATIAAVSGFVAISPAAAEPLGYTTDFNQLQILDFADGESVNVATTGSVRFSSLALAPDGRLFGVGIIVPPIDPNAPLLWTIDRETGETTYVGSNIGESGFPGDLTFDAAGHLWMTHGGSLFAVDPVAGTRTEIGGTDLVGLADRNGVLYSLRTASTCSDWDLVTLDPTTGAPTSIVPLPLFDSDHVCDVDMSLGENGALWVLAQSDTPIPIPSEFPHTLYRFEDPVTGVPVRIHDLGLFTSRAGLAVRPPEGVVAIPALGSFGMIFLALALVLAAWGILRAAATKSHSV